MSKRCHFLDRTSYILSLLFSDGAAPPRPPPPGNYGHNYVPPPRPPPPDTDDEADDVFEHAPTPSQGPIMVRSIFLKNRKTLTIF